MERPRASQSPRPCPQDEADGPWPSDEGGYGEGQSRTPGAGFVWTDGTLADPTGDDGARLFQGLDSRTPGWWGWTRGPSGSHSPAARRFGNSRTVQHPRERSAPKRMNGNQSWAWGAPEASLPPSLWLAGSLWLPLDPHNTGRCVMQTAPVNLELASRGMKSGYPHQLPVKAGGNTNIWEWSLNRGAGAAMATCRELGGRAAMQSLGLWRPEV